MDGLLVEKLLDRVLQGLHLLVVLPVSLDGFLGRQRILPVDGAGHDSIQCPVVVEGDGVVLVVVAAGAPDRQTQESTRDGIDTVEAFVGPGLGSLHGAVIPDSQAEESGAGQQLVLVLALQQVTGDLSRDEQVVGHVPVEGLDHPVAVAPGIGILGISRGAV